VEVLSRTAGGFLALLALLTLAGAAQAESFSEDAVKAAYLYRFAGYVDWPPAALGEGPFVIAVLGAAGVAEELRRLVPGHRIDGRAVEVREVRGAGDLGGPAMLYVGAGFSDRLPVLAHQLAGFSTLLVTDDEDGLNDGAVLNFVTLDHRVRFEVSLTAAERAHLKISADLLAVAVRVRGGRRQTRDVCTLYGGFDDDASCINRNARIAPVAPGWRAQGRLAAGAPTAAERDSRPAR